MKMLTFTPGKILQPFVKKYMIVETDEGCINRVLPNTSLVMAFRFKGHVAFAENNTQKSLPTCVISGPGKSGRSISYFPNTGNILVIFQDTGAHVFFKEPLRNFFGKSISLDLLDKFRNVSELEEKLGEAKDNAQRISMVEQFLISKLSPLHPDLLVAAAQKKISAMRGLVRIRELADEFCLSVDAFEKRFRKSTGMSPKQYSYILRMKAVIESGAIYQSLSEAAFRAGYFDQPHFNKDFKQFTGQTPSEFLTSPIYW